jgi:predicted nucleic acid-binding protein
VKVFLDANVLISVLNKEYPVFPYSARILSLTAVPQIRLYTSPLCWAIAFYFTEKKSGSAMARNKLKLLAEKLHFTTLTHETVQHVVNNKKIHDLEDGLQYYSALESGCTCIITEDLSDFYFSEIDVMTSRVFLENYISNVPFL